MNKTSIKILQRLVDEGVFEDPIEAADLIINLLRTPDVLSLYLKEAIPETVLIRSKINNNKSTSTEKEVIVSNEIKSDRNVMSEHMNVTSEHMNSIHVSSALKKIQSLDLSL